MSLFTPVPTNMVLTSGANSALTWTNAMSVSSISVSTLGASNLSVSTLTTSSSVSASTLTSGSISSNTLTLSLTNASTQNTQIYQVATTNPTTSYTVIQASHVSTGTTNNALALNPSGGNVGVGTTNPQHPLDIVGDMRVGYSNHSSFLVNLGTTGVAGYRSGYLFGDGTDMKLANQQNGAMIFDANNVERMRILANGNVGIGTSNPGADLEVYRNRGVGGTTQMNVTSFAGTGTITNSSIMNLRVQGAGGGMVDNAISAQFAPNSSGGTYSLAFSPMGTTAMSVLGSGNVGIGTPAPTASLHIVNPTLQAGNPAMVTAQIIARPATGGLQNAMSCGFAIGAATSSINSVGRMNVMVAGAPVAGNDYGYIPDVPVATFLGNGAVGIGTTNPQYQLDSVGNIRVSSGGNSTGAGGIIYFNSAFAVNSNPSTGPMAAIGGSLVMGGANEMGGLTFSTRPSPTGSLTERMRIKEDGNVGIGTTAPGATLDVVGNIRASTGVQITGANTINFGHNVTKEPAAGQIGYQAFSPNNALDIVGAGLSNTGRLIRLYDNVSVVGSISKASGTFDIGHPLYPDTNKRLVHSFIEGPRCDLIYRGKTTLVNGTAVVNIDKECTQSPECAMDEGTFEALCDNPQIFLQNNQTFDRVRGVIAGATLTITCETPAAVEIEWMVIAERADPFIKQWDRTNPDGYLVTQYESAAAPSDPVASVAPSGDASVPTPLSSGEEAAPAASSDPADHVASSE